MKNMNGWIAVSPKGEMKLYTFNKNRLTCQKTMVDCFKDKALFSLRLKVRTLKGWKVERCTVSLLGAVKVKAKRKAAPKRKK